MYTAHLIGRRVVVLDPEEGGELYRRGFYGRFHGIPKPRTLDVRESLELSYFEALYLVEQGVLRVVDGRGRELDREELAEIFERWYTGFREAYEVYRDLRSRGYVVRSGMKFGSTFAVYRYGPGIDHAPFLVHVLRYKDELDPIEIVRAGRLSHSVRKRFVLAYVEPGKKPEYLIFQWMM